MDPISLGIIGTAGRGEDARRLALAPARYWAMMLAAARRVAEMTAARVLVSGGAAWADHVAVALFLERPDYFRLHLAFPAPLSARAAGGMEFAENRLGAGPRDNPGRTANYYHHAFAAALAGVRDPFADFAAVAQLPESQVTGRAYDGFFARNAVVARASTHCLAMTFGAGAELKDGGTANTMGHFLRRKGHGEAFHLDLAAGKLYRNARVPAKDGRN